MQLIQSILLVLVSVWLLLCLLLFVFQAKYVYYPMSEIIATPDHIGLPYEDLYLTTEDDVKIHGWYIRHTEPRATMLLLTGNAGNISYRLEKLRIFHELGLSVLIIEYRGYGLSEGTPTEQGTYLDALAAWQYLIVERGIPADKIILYGESLGAGVATWLMDQHAPGGLIVESAFTSIVDIGRHYYPYLPVKLLTRIKYPTLERISNSSCPVLVIHSSDDEIIPLTHGLRLYEAAKEPKFILEISGDHNNGFYISRDQYSNGIARFIEQLD